MPKAQATLSAHDRAGEEAAKAYEVAHNAYRTRKVEAHLQVGGRERPTESADQWLLRRLAED